jgi:hypothetical protein
MMTMLDAKPEVQAKVNAITEQDIKDWLDSPAAASVVFGNPCNAEQCLVARYVQFLFNNPTISCGGSMYFDGSVYNLSKVVINVMCRYDTRMPLGRDEVYSRDEVKAFVYPYRPSFWEKFKALFPGGS